MQKLLKYYKNVLEVHDLKENSKEKMNEIR